MSVPKSLRAIKGIVFDLDDTLYLQADYKRSGFLAVATWLEINSGFAAESSYSEFEQIGQEMGASYPRVFDDFVIRRKLPASLTKSLVQEFITHKPQIKCFDGVQSLLRQLIQHYKVGILTDGRQTSQIKKVQALGLDSLISWILYSDSLKLEKPATELYAWFENHFELSSHQLLYVGDNPNKDFIGAKNRGWKTIRVLTGEHSSKQVSKHFEADMSISTVLNLAAMFFGESLSPN